MEEPEVEVAIKEEPEMEEDPLNLKSNQCIFCQRGTNVPVHRKRRRKLATDEAPLDIEPVPEVDLSGITTEGMTGLLETLNWMWGAPGNPGSDTNLWDVRRSQNKFQRMPTICEDCGVGVIEVGKLLREVRREMGQLRRLILWGRLRRQAEEVAMEMEEEPQCDLPEDEDEQEETMITEDLSVPMLASLDEDQDPLAVPAPRQMADERAPVSPKPEFDEDFDACDDSRDNDSDFSVSKEVSEGTSSSSEEDEPEDSYIPMKRKRIQRSSAPQNAKKKVSPSTKKEMKTPPPPPAPLKVKIPPGCTSSIEKDKTGKPLYLTVSNPTTNEQYLICLLDNCGQQLEMDANRFQAHQQEKHKPPESCWSIIRIPTAKNRKRKFKCELCGKITLEANPMRRHLKLVHNVIVEGFMGGKDYTDHLQICDLCKLKVPRRHLLEHLKEHVGAEYVLRCPNSNCLFCCIKQARLDMHLRNNAECRSKTGGDFKQYKRNLLICGVCGVEQSNMLSLRVHLLSEHETTEKNFPCPISGCGMKFSLRQSVALHLGHHDVPKKVDTQPCKKCEDKKEIKLDEMEGHLKEEHGVLEVVKCKKCPFMFSSWLELVAHMFQHRFGELFCDICGEAGGKFNRHGNLVEHYLNEHQIGSQFQCEHEHCTKAYFRLNSLQNHIKRAHKMNEFGDTSRKQVYQCDQCDYRSRTKDELRTHKIRKHGDNHLCCRFCTDTFITSVALREHESVVHKGVKLEGYPCPEPNCGKVFKVRAKLKYHHKQFHLGEKSHICEHCAKAFTLAQSLKTHVDAVHLGLRKWVCDICGDAFTSGSVLKKHKLIHTGERPFACDHDHCGQRFRHKEVLRRHLISHQEKGADFKPNGPMKKLRARVQSKKKDLE